MIQLILMLNILVFFFKVLQYLIIDFLTLHFRIFKVLQVGFLKFLQT